MLTRGILPNITWPEGTFAEKPLEVEGPMAGVNLPFHTTPLPFLIVSNHDHPINLI